MRLNVRNISDVTAGQLCSGCGTCAYISPADFEMVDVSERGLRPRLKRNRADGEASADALRACPGIALEHSFDRHDSAYIRELASAWGPVIQVWEGYACDAEIRYCGSSGGAASALALYCIEKGAMHGLLHIAATPDVPYLNHTVLSTTRQEILAKTGSRYAPASPCDGLQMIEDAPDPCVFIGKPCDVAGAVKAAKIRPALGKKLGLTIAMFCAGTPSTKGTLEMLRQMGIEDPSALVSLRYRGNGWPGKATAVVRLPDGSEETKLLCYERSWGGILSRNVQWRCRLCPDHTGEFADIAVGDPWHKPPTGDDPGRSLIVARTPRGRQIVESAISDGYLTCWQVAPRNIALSQPSLLKARASVWGRLMTCRVLGRPTPHFGRMPLFKNWLLQLSLKEKMRSVVGTARRLFRQSHGRPPERGPIVASAAKIYE
jgi:coenzyme F420 hydrogenase subunit beta